MNAVSAKNSRIVELLLTLEEENISSNEKDADDVE